MFGDVHGPASSRGPGQARPDLTDSHYVTILAIMGIQTKIPRVSKLLLLSKSTAGNFRSMLVVN